MSSTWVTPVFKRTFSDMGYPMLGRCGLGLFWWGPKGSCLPNGGLTQWYNPPSYRNCGERWYWHNTLGYCVPPHPGYPDAGCWSGWGWDAGSYSCVPVNGHYKE
ncbi:hypothetical protein RhiLY_05741 [Ceratobasidium sp. AG-Ba]|nr:hypothetical protein RhiLY_05741 [Ceratobasidium sp. AG-Ba]